MISDEQRMEAVKFLRDRICLKLDCRECHQMSKTLLGDEDALCAVSDHWKRLADFIDRPTTTLHVVTARHLRRARRTIRKLRKREDELQKVCDVQSALLYAYRGCNATTDTNASVPEHYQGDGYVTCDRAIEAASAQRCIVDRPPLRYWYWATAFKYVWRMWSKADPEADMRKAIDCLEKAAGICRAVELDG